MGQVMADIYESLSDKYKEMLVSYGNFLIEQQKNSSAKKNSEILEEMRAMVCDDNPWSSEEEMLFELAEERRKFEAERQKNANLC